MLVLLAALALSAAMLAPALADTGPAMNAAGNNVNIAVIEPNHSLKIYWPSTAPRLGTPK